MCTVRSAHMHNSTTTDRNNKLIPQAVLINHRFVVVQEATNCAVNCFSHHSAGSMCNDGKMPIAHPHTHLFYFTHLDMPKISHRNVFDSRERKKKTRKTNTNELNMNKGTNFTDCDISVNYAIFHFINILKIENIFKSNTIIMHSNIHYGATRARIENQIKLC